MSLGGRPLAVARPVWPALSLPRVALQVGLLPAAVALLGRLLAGPRTIDDAYITFRYARNLAEGQGLVYNPGEWVLGTTTPLWAILLAAGARLGATDLPTLATVLAACCDAGTAALLAWLALRLGCGRGAAVGVGLAWACNPLSVAFATGGMEASLFVLLGLGALTLAAARREAPAAALAGLSGLTRPEGVLVVAAVLGWALLTRRRLPWRAALIAATPLAAAGAMLAWRYGSPVPHSVTAKQVAYQGVGPMDNVAALVAQAGLPGGSTFLLAALPPAASVLLVVFGVASLAVLLRGGLPWLTRRRLPWPPFAAFATLYVLFYVAVGLRGVRMFPWYLVPVAPLYLLGAASGLARLGTAGGALRPWLPALLLIWQLPAVDWRAPFEPRGFVLVREAAILAAARDLGPTLPAGATVAAPEVGALGYALPGVRVLDTVGLVSPEALAYYPLPDDLRAADNAIPPRLVADLQPDAIVALEVFARRSLLPDPAFQRRYRLDRVYPADTWDSQGLLVFRRTP